jgi:hypothetical protein
MVASGSDHACQGAPRFLIDEPTAIVPNSARLKDLNPAQGS